MTLMIECPVCDSQDVRVSLTAIDGAQVGLPGVSLINVREVSCDECGEASYDLPEHSLLTTCVSRELAQSQGQLSAAAFATLRRSLMSGVDFSGAVGVTNVTVSRWENAQVRIPRYMSLLLRALAFLPQQIRRELIDTEKLGACTHIPSIDVGGLDGTMPEWGIEQSKWSALIPADYVIGAANNKDAKLMPPSVANDSVYEWIDVEVA